MEIWRDVFRDTPKKIRERKDFRFPPIIPIVLYNGKNNWTAAKSFKDIVAQSSLFPEYILDFQYILIDVNRYNEKELLKVGNLMSSIFYMEQNRNTYEIIERLEKLAYTLDGLDDDGFQAFKSWINKIVCQGLPKGKQEKISEILNKSEEVDSMISNVTKAIREDRKKSKREGRTEVLIKLLVLKFGQVPGDIIVKINESDESQIEAIIDSIFEIQSLEEINKHFK